MAKSKAASSDAPDQQQQLINIQAQQLAAQVANWAAQLEFQKARFSQLELPSWQQQAQLDVDKFAWTKAQDAWENAFKEATLTGTYQGQPTLEWLTKQAEMTGVLNGQETIQGKLTNAQIAQMNSQMKLANDTFLANTTGYINGQPTFDREKWQATQAVAGWQFISSLSGPQNAFKQARAISTMPGGLSQMMDAWAGTNMSPGTTSVGSGGQASLGDMRSGYGGINGSTPYQYGAPPPPPSSAAPFPTQGTPGGSGIAAPAWPVQPTPTTPSVSPPISPVSPTNPGYPYRQTDPIPVPSGSPTYVNESEASGYPYRQTDPVPFTPGAASQYSELPYDYYQTDPVPTSTGQTAVPSHSSDSLMPDAGVWPVSSAQEQTAASPPQFTPGATYGPTTSPYTYSAPGVQAPTDAWNYTLGPGGGVQVYPPGVASPADTPDVSTTSPISPPIAAMLHQGQYTYGGVAQAGSGTTTTNSALGSIPLPNQINARNYANMYQYNRDLGWANYEDAGWDPSLAKEAFQKSLPKYAGPTSGHVAF